MSSALVGRGTWLDMVAKGIVERERKLGRNMVPLRTESGLGASGIPHIGSMADGVRAYGIKLALESIGSPSEFTAFSDDLDGLRQVPRGLDPSLAKYIGHPVTSIPDPFRCHESYGDHMSGLLREAFDACGIEYKFLSAKDCYRRGRFNAEIDKILGASVRVGDIINEELGQEKFTEILPYFPICERCGKIYSTVARRYLPKAMKVLYRCQGTSEIRGQTLEGCGHDGEIDIRSGLGKLSWKVEFAARWSALKINFEAYGKDIADSVRVNDRISSEILGYPPPYHVKYEMFLDKTGRKISKSTGNVFTPQVWLRYGSPQSLLLLMFKRVVGTRNLSVDDIPTYVTELDRLEEIYFGQKKVDDSKELAKLRGLYEYAWLLKVPSNPRIHIPYSLIVYLATVAPKEARRDYVIDKLKEYGYLENRFTPDLDNRIEYGANWADDFGELRAPRFELSDAERSALIDFAALVRSGADGEKIQDAVYEIARSHKLKPAAFFQLLYRALLGATSGPRLGPYVEAVGNKAVLVAIEQALNVA